MRCDMEIDTTKGKKILIHVSKAAPGSVCGGAYV